MTNKEIMLAEMILAERDKKGFYILVNSTEFATPELILNQSENLTAKRRYYEQAYNDKLELIAKPDIKITNFGSFTRPNHLPKGTFTENKPEWDILPRI